MTTITGLTSIPAVAAGDELPIYDVSAGATRKIARSVLLGGTLTGDGTIATGGYTATVPASMTLAGRNVANTFTAAQTIDAQTSIPLTLTSYDNGAFSGPRISIGYNNNGSTPAAGSVLIYNLSGSARYIWPDNSGNLRIHATFPTNANDSTAGTVVGTQTSNIAFKVIKGDPIDGPAALAALSSAAAQVQRFVYRSGAYNNQEFSGLILQGPELDRYGLDPDPDYPAGKSLNVINVIGDLLLAIRHLAERIERLESPQL